MFILSSCSFIRGNIVGENNSGSADAQKYWLATEIKWHLSKYTSSQRPWSSPDKWRPASWAALATEFCTFLHVKSQIGWYKMPFPESMLQQYQSLLMEPGGLWVSRELWPLITVLRCFRNYCKSDKFSPLKVKKDFLHSGRSFSQGGPIMDDRSDWTTFWALTHLDKYNVVKCASANLFLKFLSLLFGRTRWSEEKLNLGEKFVHSNRYLYTEWDRLCNAKFVFILKQAGVHL